MDYIKYMKTYYSTLYSSISIYFYIGLDNLDFHVSIERKTIKIILDTVNYTIMQYMDNVSCIDRLYKSIFI